MNTLGSRIRAAREQQGKTLEWLAANAGVSKGFLSEVERGKSAVTVERCAAIAEKLGVSMNWLATGNEKPFTCPFCNGTGVM